MISLHLESPVPALASLRVHGFTGRERISQLYHLEVDVLSEEDTPDLADLVGSDLVLVLSWRDEEVRRFHGMLHAIETRYEPEATTWGGIRLHLVPRSRQLTYVRSQEIHLGLSVPDIIKEQLGNFDLASAASLKMVLGGSYPKRDFVVQWDETNLAFLNRLTEHLGISYFFEQSETNERIVFTDDAAGFPVTPGLGVAHLVKRDDEVGIRKLTRHDQCVPRNFIVMDYNYRAPAADLTASRELDGGFAGGVIEYGPHVKTAEESAAIVRARAEEHEAQRVVYRGESDLCAITAGHRFRIDGHPKLDGVEVLAVEVEHEASVSSDTTKASYRNTFRAVPVSSSTYRPPRVTPKPRLPGLITGIVQERVEGEPVERYARIDEHGRYVIRFLFDITPREGTTSSHAVRKAEPTVGPDYGMHFPLRPGVEVIMAFVNGDPDRPVVLGALHNAVVPAQVRDANAMVNSIKTASGIKMHFKDD